MSASDGDEAVNQIEGTDEAEETLTALIRAAFPHEREIGRASCRERV